MSQDRSNVPKLSEFAKRQCMRFAHHVGDARYELVSPILKRMPPRQLALVEDKSPQIKARSGEIWKDFIKKDFHDRPQPMGPNYRKIYNKYYKQKQQMLNEASARLRESTQKYQKEKESRTISTLEVDPLSARLASRRKAQSASTPSGSRLIHKAWATARAKGPVFSTKNTQFTNSFGESAAKRQRMR